MKSHSKLLLLATFLMLSCLPQKNKDNDNTSNLYTDFPNSSELIFNSIFSLDIQRNGAAFINDSTLWHFEMNNDNLGYCHDLNNMKKLSAIITKGKASYELSELGTINFVGDSIQFGTQHLIKSFSIKDIENNLAINERGFSEYFIPQNIKINRGYKLSNGDVIGTIPPLSNEEFDASSNNLVLISKDDTKYYNTINYLDYGFSDSELNSSVGKEIKQRFSECLIGTMRTDKAIFALTEPNLAFYTFDLQNGKVLNRKQYAKYNARIEGNSCYLTNDLNLRCEKMMSNDNYICFHVSGYFSEVDKENSDRKEAFLIFDWDLNPIKRFDLKKRKNGYYTMSNDCKKAYFCEHSKNGFLLHIAKTNL